LLTPEVSQAQNAVFLALQYRFSYSILLNDMGCLTAAKSGYRLTGLPFFMGVPVASMTPRQAGFWHRARVFLVRIDVIVCIAWASSATTTKLEKAEVIVAAVGTLAHDAAIMHLDDPARRSASVRLAAVARSFTSSDVNPTMSPSRFQFSISVQGAMTTRAHGLCSSHMTCAYFKPTQRHKDSRVSRVGLQHNTWTMLTNKRFAESHIVSEDDPV
jgi:hypothetical protein